MPAPYEQIAYAVEGGVATITLNRPDKLNAFTEVMRDELIDAFGQTDGDDDVRAVILTGAGRGFCAGADLEGGGGTFASADTADTHRDGGGQVTLRMFESKKPLIAAINGPAVGVGITMCLPADIRLAATTARFGFVFARRGIVPEACSSWFLPRIVGISTALEWTMTGRVFEAAEAHERGLVRSLHAPAELLGAARVLAREVAEHSAPVSVALTRELLWRGLGAAHPAQAHRADSRAIFLRGHSADAQEGVTAFLEKRPAAFPDRVSDGVPHVFGDADG